MENLKLLLYIYLIVGIVNLLLTLFFILVGKKAKNHQKNLSNILKNKAFKGWFWGTLAKFIVIIVTLIYVIILWPHSVRSGIKRLKSKTI